MADGKFNQGGAEQLNQSGITRERMLVVDTSPVGAIPTLTAGTAVTFTAASSYASLDPNDTSAGQLEQLGPHFVMSAITPDGSHPYGFKFCLSTDGLLTTAAVAAAGGFTVTPWVLLGSAQIPNLPAAYRQQWASLAAGTGVGLKEWWHSFDVNACAIRFQIGNIASHGLLAIYFAEL